MQGMEPRGFEPLSPTCEASILPVELRPHGGRGRNRTYDLQHVGLTLPRLSYASKLPAVPYPAGEGLLTRRRDPWCTTTASRRDGDGGDRTRSLRSARPVLPRLSYIPLVAQGGFEPPPPAFQTGALPIELPRQDLYSRRPYDRNRTGYDLTHNQAPIHLASHGICAPEELNLVPGFIRPVHKPSCSTRV